MHEKMKVVPSYPSDVWRRFPTNVSSLVFGPTLVCCHFYAAVCCHYMIHQSALVATAITTQILITFLLDYLTWNRRELLKTWNKVYSSTDCLRQVDVRVLRKCKIFVLLSLVVLVTDFVVATLLSTSPLQSVEYQWLSSYCFGCNLTRLSPRVQKLLIFSDKYLNLLVNDLPGIAIPTVLGCLYLLLADLFQKTILEIVPLTTGTNLKMKDIVIIRNKIRCLQMLTAEANKILWLVNLMWFLISFFSTCFGVTMFIMFFGELTGVQFWYYLFQSSIPIAYASFFSFCASRIPETLSEGLKMAQGVNLSYETTDPGVYGELLVLFSQLSTPPTGMTLGGSFVITKASFLSHLAGIVSYIIVLLQLFPDLMKKLRGEI